MKLKSFTLTFKKLFQVSLLALASLTLSEAYAADEELKVAADAIPHAEILEHIQKTHPELNLKVIEIANGVNPNELLAGGDVQANYFQHIPYLRTQEEALKRKFEVVATVHIEPLGIYSKKYKSLSEIPEAAVVAVPNNASNLSRALFLLQANGLIKLKPEFTDASKLAKPSDIAENPKKIEIKEIEAPILPQVLPDVALSIINGNYALEAGLKPAKDALALEKVEGNPYGNILVTTPELAKNEKIQNLAKILESAEIAKFINERYEGSVIPVHADK